MGTVRRFTFFFYYVLIIYIGVVYVKLSDNAWQFLIIKMLNKYIKPDNIIYTNLYLFVYLLIIKMSKI